MFEIINDTDKRIEELDYLEEYVTYVTKKEKIEQAIFNIIFVTNDKIRELNRTYRGIDRVTDVISFALEDGEEYKNPEIRVLGDIYIAVDVAYEQSEIYGHSKIREVCFLVTHGILHLLGYDHIEEEDEKVMFAKQKELLEEYEITR